MSLVSISLKLPLRVADLTPWFFSFAKPLDDIFVDFLKLFTSVSSGLTNSLHVSEFSQK